MRITQCEYCAVAPSQELVTHQGEQFTLERVLQQELNGSFAMISKLFGDEKAGQI